LSQRPAARHSTDADPALRAGQRDFTDFDELVDAIPFESEYVQIERGSVRSELTRVQLDRLAALRFSEDVPAYVFRATAPTEALTLAFLARPSHSLRWGGRPVNESTLLGYGPGAEHVGTSRGRAATWSLHFALGALESHAAKLGHRIDWAPLSARVLAPGPIEIDGLRQATQQLFNYAESARSSFEHPGICRLHEEAILTAAVRAIVPADEQDHSSAASHQRAVRRAVEVLEARADEPVYLAELCEAAAVSERTLRSAFQRLYGVSPIRYLHLHRMKQARLALLSADPERDKVSEVAGRFGFANLGRFAVEFRELFGQSPSQVLRSPR